jgi:branched-chain amino acid transport system ATP-binding protein
MDLWAAALIVAALFAAVAVGAALVPRLVGADAARRRPRLARLIGVRVASLEGNPAAPANGAADGVTITGRRAVPRGHGDAKGTLTLEGRAINVAFGGVRAVDGVSVRVAPGQRVGIVGANGAGKTTLFNALTGFVPLTGGEVRLGEDDISGWPSFARARHGVRRTFQQPRVADTLTVEQNIFCGHGNQDTPERNQRADWLLEHFGLADRRGLPLAALPFGQRREVELIRALMRTPQVLMLDEPVSGLEDEEVEKLVSTLLELQRDEGWGLVVIEHDLQFITHVAEHLMVMEDGRLLREGPLHAVMKEPEVRRVYLGELVDV